MSKILLVEDNYDVTEAIKELCEEKGWEYDRVNKVVDAMDLYEEEYYDCIIIDLVIDPLGLTDEEINKFYPYFGWAWMKNYLLNNNRKETPGLIKKKTIIFSEYVSGLIDSKTWKGELSGLNILKKSDALNLENLYMRINDIITKKI